MKFIALFILLFATSAFAGQTNKIKSVGFSKDGAYYAYIKYGVGDGTGAAYAYGYVVSVSANKVMTKSEYEEDYLHTNPTGEESLAVTAALKDLKLEAFKITPYEILGEELLSRSLNDRSSYVTTSFSVADDSPENRFVSIHPYSLTVTETEAPKLCEEGKLLKLTLIDENARPEKLIRTISEDTEKNIPSARWCGNNYAVRRVISYKDSVVVNVSYDIPEHEGPRVDQMVITTIQPLVPYNTYQ